MACATTHRGARRKWPFSTVTLGTKNEGRPEKASEVSESLVGVLCGAGIDSCSAAADAIHAANASRASAMASFSVAPSPMHPGRSGNVTIQPSPSPFGDTPKSAHRSARRSEEYGFAYPCRVSNPTATVNQKRRDLGITSRINLASLRLTVATDRGLRAVHPRLQREGIAPTT